MKCVCMLMLVPSTYLSFFLTKVQEAIDLERRQREEMFREHCAYLPTLRDISLAMLHSAGEESRWLFLGYVEYVMLSTGASGERAIAVVKDHLERFLEDYSFKEPDVDNSPEYDWHVYFTLPWRAVLNAAG